LSLVMRGHVEHALLEFGIASDLGELPIVDNELAEQVLWRLVDGHSRSNVGPPLPRIDGFSKRQLVRLTLPLAAFRVHPPLDTPRCRCCRFSRHAAASAFHVSAP